MNPAKSKTPPDLDLSKAERLVGYQPTRTLNDIISDVANEFRQSLDSESQSKTQTIK